jgi:hypothetical protein
MEVKNPVIGDLVFFPKENAFGIVIEQVSYGVKIHWPNLCNEPMDCVDPIPSDYLIFDNDHSEKSKLVIRLKHGNK